MLRIYNTLTRTKEEFRPIEPGHVRMYVCGMTVYDYCHLGHARVLVAFDVVVRYLRSRGYRVTYVRNVTDVDDKIIARANENGEDFRALTQRFTGYMHEDCRALGVPGSGRGAARDPLHRAHRLDGGAADRTWRRLPGCERGRLLRREHLSRLRSPVGSEGRGPAQRRPGRDRRGQGRSPRLRAVEVVQARRAELGFSMGSGAAGLAHRVLGDVHGLPGTHHFDIHGGGMDLQFPHHENEIAQSEAATGGKFVNVWMHNGFVRIDDEKMSKSLGNFFTLRNVLERYPAESVRCFMLSSHYRSPLNYSEDHLRQADASVRRLYTALRGLDGPPTEPDPIEPDGDWLARFRAAMDDDFNTPEAISVLFDLAHEIHRARAVEPDRARALAGTLRALGAVLGLLGADADAWLRGASTGGSPDDGEIEAMIARRTEARARRDWGEADRLRDELAAAGIILEDGAQGTAWRRVRS